MGGAGRHLDQSGLVVTVLTNFLQNILTKPGYFVGQEATRCSANTKVGIKSLITAQGTKTKCGLSSETF